MIFHLGRRSDETTTSTPDFILSGHNAPVGPGPTPSVMPGWKKVTLVKVGDKKPARNGVDGVTLGFVITDSPIETEIGVRLNVWFCVDGSNRYNNQTEWTRRHWTAILKVCRRTSLEDCVGIDFSARFGHLRVPKCLGNGWCVGASLTPDGGTAIRSATDYERLVSLDDKADIFGEILAVDGVLRPKAGFFEIRRKKMKID